ncbi:hypothetical protein OVA29_16725 [Exiguobacterium sp. SL14]|nr:hypothetical protein [Exiguobacterium sp. SL14]
MLHLNPPKTHRTHEQSVLLRAFSIDARHQHQGYAKEAMMQLPEFVHHHFPKLQRLHLRSIKRISPQNRSISRRGMSIRYSPSWGRLESNTFLRLI